MVSAQQEAKSLFLKSDTDRKATPSEQPVHCTIVDPLKAPAKDLSLSFNAHVFEEDVKMGWLSKALHGD